MNRFAILGLVCCLVAVNPLAAQEKLPPGGKLVKVEARPEKIDLKSPFEYRQLLLTGILDNGDRIDVTRIAQFTIPDKTLKISERGLVRPIADGSGELKYTIAGQTGTIPVNVSEFSAKHEVSFVRDVMPTISRLGCNAGTCHGSAQGKNGFQLSLRGYDALFDHRALTDDISARRFNRAAPDRSLMLLKPSGGVPHVGGVLCQPGDPNYELLRAWIAQGVKLDLATTKPVRIEVYPKSAVLPLAEFKQQMTVSAFYADGKVRDVTAEAFLESSNTECATVDKQGLVTAIRRGESALLARYEGNYAAATVIVMGDRGGFAWQKTPEFNWIDTLVYDKLKQLKIQPSDLSTDSEFIRRVHLDLTGLPPEPEAVRAFLADTRPTQVKRDELVDKLVGSPDFVEHWTNKWADLLQVNRKYLGTEGTTAYRKWIQDALTQNMPYDQFAYKLLTGTGSNVEHPEASYMKILREPEMAMETTTHLFLATRFNCNKCHDHPFERWTQNQYYELSSFFAQVSRREDPKHKGKRTEGTAVQGGLPLVEIVEDGKGGEVKNLRTGDTAKPKFPYEHGAMPPTSLSRREQIAKWVTAKENPYFAKSYVNRIWSYLLGVGIIEPVDDIRAGNPPSNPQLLDKLTQEFIAGGFNVRELMKTICKSRTYQHSLATNQWNKDDDTNYSHALARRLSAEVLYDAIHRSLGSKSKLPGLPVGARAAQLVDANVPLPGSFLEVFGRPPRESACECERSNSMLLGSVLNLVNGSVLNDALADPSNRIAQILAKEKDDARVVDELYLAILCRLPSEKERAVAMAAFTSTEAEFARLQAERKKRDQAVLDYEKQLPQAQAKWEATLQRPTVWTVLTPQELKSVGGAKLARQPDDSILASGPNPSPDTYTIVAHSKLKDITGVRLEVLADPSLPKNGPGRSPANGNFVLSEFKVEFGKLVGDDKLTAVKLVAPQATFSQDQFPIANAIDGNLATGWAISPQLGKSHMAVFQAQNKFGTADGVKLVFTMSQQFAGKDHSIGKFRLSVTDAPPPILLTNNLPENIAKIVATPKEKRSQADLTALSQYYRGIDTELPRLRAYAAEVMLPTSQRAMGAQDLGWALINSPAFLFNR